jgi:simple sugar transport system permease protein
MPSQNHKGEKMNNTTGKRIINFIFDYKVPILFLALSVAGVLVSKQSLNFLFLELLARFGRDTFLVIALIIPVITGMGLNFSIVVGAMAAQVAVFFVTNWLQTGIPTCPAPLAFLLCVLLCTPLAILFGWLAGKLFNKIKGAEMIGGLILGYFSDGLYQFFFLFVLGGIIPIANKTLMLATGIGVKNSVDLATNKKFTGLKYSVDNILKLPLVDCLKYLFVAVVLYGIVMAILQKVKGKKLITSKYWVLLAVSTVFFGLSFLPSFIKFAEILRIPVVTYLLIGGLCLFIEWLLKTRLGQNMRAVGQNRVVANSAGIDVDRTRVIAIIISTVLASYGQLLYIQNLGVFTTYGAHTNVALYSIAALLVGGASVYKATVKQAIVGVLLFHTLFIVSPLAGQTLMNDAMIGEYFRVFICYGVIAMSLVMHAWKKKKEKKTLDAGGDTPAASADLLESK